MARDTIEREETVTPQSFRLLVAVASVAKSHIGFLEKVKESAEKSLDGVTYDYYVSNPGDGGHSEIVEGFNSVIEKVLREGYDYVWFLEADVVVPKNSFQKLLADDADVASGVTPYHKIAPVYENLMVAGRFLSEGSFRTVNLHKDDVLGKILEGDVWSGTSCLLVKRQVFEKGLRFVDNKEIAGLDLLFWKSLKTHGFKFLVDGNVVCEDLG